MRCGKCSDEVHEMANCEASEWKYWHYENEHVFIMPTTKRRSRICKEYKYQEEIPAVQAKEQITKHQAVLIFNQRNPKYMKMKYSEAVKGRTCTAKDIGDIGICTEITRWQGL